MSEKAIVYAEDMTDEMMNEAIKTAKNAFQSGSKNLYLPRKIWLQCRDGLCVCAEGAE